MRSNLYLKLYDLHRKPELESYNKFYEEGHLEALKSYYKKRRIERIFSFLGELYHRLVEEERYEALALPYFISDGRCFKDIVKSIAKEDYTRGILKKFGEKTNVYGVKFLNNAWVLKRIDVNKTINIHELLKLDHNKKLSKKHCNRMHGLGDLFSYYPLSRVFKIMIDSGDEGYKDTAMMLKEYQALGKNIKSILPRRPCRILDIHDALSRALLEEKGENYNFNQDVDFLDGKALLDFVIEVPRDVSTLVSTSRELDHCVHTYGKAIKRGHCQILNLKKNGKRYYTVELRKSSLGYVVKQIKGFKNESSMEGEKGTQLRKELYTLLGHDPDKGECGQEDDLLEEFLYLLGED